MTLGRLISVSFWDTIYFDVRAVGFREGRCNEFADKAAAAAVAAAEAGMEFWNAFRDLNGFVFVDDVVFFSS